MSTPIAPPPQRLRAPSAATWWCRLRVKQAAGTNGRGKWRSWARGGRSGAEGGAASFYAWMRREGVLIQTILFTPEEVTRYYALRERGVLGAGKDFLLFVLGR